MCDTHPPVLQGQPVPSIGAWADLQSQLQRRRAELNGKTSAHCIPAINAAPGSAAEQDSAEADITAVATKRSTTEGIVPASAAAGDPQSNGMAPMHARQSSDVGPLNVSKGAVRPRGGVRASAMGPLLNFLRNSGGLETEP